MGIRKDSRRGVGGVPLQECAGHILLGRGIGGATTWQPKNEVSDLVQLARRPEEQAADLGRRVRIVPVAVVHVIGFCGGVPASYFRIAVGVHGRHDGVLPGGSWLVAGGRRQGVGVVVVVVVQTASRWRSRRCCVEILEERLTADGTKTTRRASAVPLLPPKPTRSITKFVRLASFRF